MATAVETPVFAWLDRGFAYLPITKAGCTSIKTALRKARDLPMPKDWWLIHSARWPELRSLHWAQYRKNLQKPTHIFAVIRNPWDRLWSCYKSKITADCIVDLNVDHPRMRVGMSFAEFCEVVCSIPDSLANPHVRTQWPQLTLGGVPVVNEVIDFPDLPNRWEGLAADYKLGPLGNLNPTSKRPAPWSSSLVSMIGDRFAIDCARFRYSAPGARMGGR